MELNFRKLLSLLLILPALATTSAAEKGQPSHPAGSPHANSDDIICHGLTCYPRVFVPTHEFQIIHDDQEVPPGLHVRLNFQTGVREAKINVPDEGLDKEAATIHLPSEGGTGELLFVPGPEEGPEATGPKIKLPKEDDPHGAVKPPLTANSEQMPFTNSVEIVLKPNSHTDAELNQALMSLENLVHEIYWGLKIATPENISALLNLVSTSPEASIRSSAALVIGSALSNNPKALKSAIGGSTDIKLIPTILTSLQSEPDNDARARIMYALNQAIKSPQTISDFNKAKGMGILKTLFEAEFSDEGEFKAKCSTFVEDNFLNEDFKSDSEKQNPSQKLTQQKGSQAASYLQRTATEEIIKAFCPLFQSALLSTTSLGITEDDHKIKLLSALIALRKKVGTDLCPTSVEFLKWFKDITNKKGRSLQELEDQGEWFRLMAMENKDSFLDKRGSWF